MSSLADDGGSDGDDAPQCAVVQCLTTPASRAPRAPGDEGSVVTTVAFDADGGMVAMGDRGGRVCVFERDRSSRTPRYEVLCEFQSHDPEFDYLKSLEVEEKINQLRFCRGLGRRSCRVLAANDKTIKLWAVRERRTDAVLENSNADRLSNGWAPTDASELRVPRVRHGGVSVSAQPCRTYAHAHAYHINSVSVNSDGEHFASADDLRVNVWNLEIEDRAFNVVDLKPPNMEDLTEVITAAAFHPVDCHALLYASSRGAVKLFDLRQAARCDAHAKLFDDAADDAAPARGDDAKSFFSEIVSSISDARFDPTGRYVVARDFLSVKVWDTRLERRPVSCRAVHDHLKPRLCDLYESDCIFDKFEVAAGPGAEALATGSYSDAAHVIDGTGRRAAVDLASDASAAPARLAPGEPPAPADADFRRRVLHVAAHPREETFAVAGLDRCFVFSVERRRANGGLGW